MNYAALKSEITSDPESIGYAGKGDLQVSELMNARTRQPPAKEITGGQVAAAIDLTELAASVVSGASSYVTSLFGCQSIPVTPTLKSNLLAIFGQGSNTRSNLVAALKRTGSRAEEIGLDYVTPSDVAEARRFQG